MKIKTMLTEKEVSWAYEQWCIGYTQPQIANALYCSEKTIMRAFRKRNLRRIRPVLKAPKELYE